MIKRINERIKTLTFWDIGFVKWSVFFATIIIVKFFPQLLNISYPVLIILMIVCMTKPIYKVYVKK